jgi:hypothetical protein
LAADKITFDVLYFMALANIRSLLRRHEDAAGNLLPVDFVSLRLYLMTRLILTPFDFCGDYGGS